MVGCTSITPSSFPNHYAELHGHTDSEAFSLKVVNQIRSLRLSFIQNSLIANELAALEERIRLLRCENVFDGEVGILFLNDVQEILDKATPSYSFEKELASFVRDAISLSPNHFIHRIQRLCSGREKDIWIKGGEARATHVFYTAKQSGGILGRIRMAWRRRELIGELRVCKDISQTSQVRREDLLQHLALDLEEVPQQDRIHGEYTLNRRKAMGDLTKVLQGSLSPLDQRQQAACATEALNYAGDVLHGVAALHEAEFVHADLKPENVLVFAEGASARHAKIADFGLTRKMTATDRPGFYCGNQRFSPPENTLSHKGEVFSAGLILIEIMESRFLTSEEPMLVRLAPGQLKTGSKGAVLEEQKGIDRFLTLNKHCPQTARTGMPTLYGRVKAFVKRWGTAFCFSRLHKIDVQMSSRACTHEVHTYIKALTAKMRNSFPPPDENALLHLQYLLCDMTQPDPNSRPTMAAALDRYTDIMKRLFIESSLISN